MDWKTDLNVGDFCEFNHQLRPHVVWFGEPVPKLQHAIEITEEADILIIVGTSMQVYPAAALLDFSPAKIPIYFIDPNPAIYPNKYLEIIKEKAALGVPELSKRLLAEAE